MKVLVVEDDERRMVYFDEWFRNDDMDWAPTAKEGIAFLLYKEYDLVCLDHDLAAEHYADLAEGAAHGTGTGRDVADFLAESKLARKPFVIVHSWNPYGAAAMTKTLDAANFEVVQREFGPIIELIIDQVRSKHAQESALTELTRITEELGGYDDL